jgi:hypothetical protein
MSLPGLGSPPVRVLLALVRLQFLVVLGVMVLNIFLGEEAKADSIEASPHQRMCHRQLEVHQEESRHGNGRQVVQKDAPLKDPRWYGALAKPHQ